MSLSECRSPQKAKILGLKNYLRLSLGANVIKFIMSVIYRCTSVCLWQAFPVQYNVNE